MKPSRALFLSLIFISALVICLPCYANDTKIYACYKKIGGQLRIVNPGSTCLPSEVPIWWNQAGLPGPTGPAGPAGPQGPAGAPSNGSGNVTVRQTEPNPCAGMYGWCPDGFKWVFHILDPAVNRNSVVAINVVNPLLYDYGCEVATKGLGEFLIMCIGYDYIMPGAILQYAIFNP